MRLHAVDKPLGLTSHDVVARARRLLGTRRVGHAGTLDPLATGVLIVMADEATKLSSYLTGHDKSYLAWVTFGATTPTLDAEGPMASVADASHLTESEITAEMDRFLAITTQRPPAYSAVKRAGVRSYAAARRGEAEEPPARPVAYREVQLVALAGSLEELPQRFAPVPGAGPGKYQPHERGREFDLPPGPGLEEGVLPSGAEASTKTALVRLTVGAGTYVRSFARDLGAALGLPAFLSGLVRTASGAVDLAATTTLDDLPGAAAIDAVAALELPTLTLGAVHADDVRHGRRPPLAISERTALVDEAGTLVALAEGAPAGHGYRLLRVFN